jgi:hypothetical protein
MPPSGGIPMSDALAWLHGKDRSSDGSFAGTAICHSASEASELYLDGEVTYLDLGGRPGLGLMIYVTETFNTLAGILFEIVHSASAAPTTTNVIGARYLALADLVAGKRYFIPFYAKTILRYLGAYAALDGSACSAGKVCMWIAEGPAGAD